jgi:hypothetical protein
MRRNAIIRADLIFIDGFIVLNNQIELCEPLLAWTTSFLKATKEFGNFCRKITLG